MGIVEKLLFFRPPFVLALLLFISLPTAPAIASKVNKPLLSNIYLDILESGVDVFEPLFTESATDVPNAGFYDFRKYGNWTHPRNEAYHTLCMIPGNGQVVLSYAVLLKYSKKTHFGKVRYPKELLFDRVKKVIRWIILTSAYVDKPYPFLPEVRQDMSSGRQWKRSWGLRQDLLGHLSLGIALLWDDLDQETRRLFEQVATGAALRERIVRTAGPSGNGNHDQVKQDLSSTVAAAYLFPHHPDHDDFMAAISGAGIDMVSTAGDYSSERLVGSIPLKNLAKGANLSSDYSSLHHNHPSLWYGVDLILEGRLYVEIMSALTGIPVPDTYRYPGNGFDGVYQYANVLTTQDGVMMHLRSPEYDAYYGEGLLAFCFGNLLKNDPVGAYLEEKAALVLSWHTKAIGEYDYHRGSWGKAAMAFLMHQLHPGVSPVEVTVQHLSSLNGTYHFQGLRALIHRTGKSWNSFIWGPTDIVTSGGPGGYVVPGSAGGPFIYNTTDSLSGAVLQHRPLWIYATMSSFILLGFVGGYICRHKYREAASVFFTTALSCFAIVLLVAWIDLNHTLALHIPHSIIPRWPLAAVTVLASLATLWSIIKRQNKTATCDFSKSLIVSMVIVPLTLLIMVRTPWLEILSGSNVYEIPIVYFAAMTVCLIVCISAKRDRGRVLLIAITSCCLLFSSIGLGALLLADNVDPLYLRLVSIRNVPRIYTIGCLGLATLGLGSFLWVIKVQKKYIVVVCELSIVIFLSCLAVVSLSFGRFDLPSVSRVHYEASDDGFSTAGESLTSVAKTRQAFFSFEGGLGIVFIYITGQKNALVSWSGLPVSFYQRNGYVPSRTVTYEAGMSPVDQLEEVLSDWWSVDNKLGMVTSGEMSVLRGQKQLGVKCHDIVDTF